MAMVLRLSTALLLSLLLVGCSKLFFYPMSAWVQNPENQGLEYEDIVLIHPRGMRIHGWWLPAANDAPARGTVYFLHGNAQNISTHLANVQWLPAQGYNVFLLDYRGYGLSEGKPRLPEALDDVQLGLDWLRHAKRTEGAPLVVFGQSLGASMVASVLGEKGNAGAADCVILEAAFASYRDITSDVMKRSWLLWPLRWMVVPAMPDRELDPEVRVAGIKPTPLLVMHSVDDPVIPYAHGERLYAAAQQPKTFQKLRGGHTESSRDPAVQQRLVDFMQDNNCAAKVAEVEQPVAPSDDESPPELFVPLPAPDKGYRF
ncbi:alpha/beta hydrolase [Alcanivorax borkumensis]|uniref:Lipoprotein, putative n=1 Tax=Alcanivorax borkumensis (strain ATCC 700651 / DSM 11573 / NCIMB 13689 / SK2) TaxID=393595 RepID=Q0VM97_ALCBS|nr:alpha/beta fold hydrolase [Alcanivorax borkumensis]CAL17701.1 lipoprotein, putative [Alcanivorax borkumensis SK2]